MERVSRFRSRVLMLLFIVVVGFLAYTLYDLQIIETGGNTDNTTTYTSWVRVKAARGDILDSNGNVLVSNRASYDLVINHYVLVNANGTNDYLYRLVKLCQAEGIEYTDRFPISRERPFTYTLDDYSSIWQGYFQTYLAEDDLDSDITAPLLVQKLRARYSIPAEWTDDEARLVIGLRYEMSLRNCILTLPNYVFLSDASDEALSDIMELNIPGMTVEASTVREYNTKYAAHILGYVGAMSPEQWEYYKTIDGYGMDAEVGQSGLELAYEEYLHGVDGWREDTVTADGTLVSSIYVEEPRAGSNVEVSIDLNLQIAAEDQLAYTIQNLQAQEEDKDGADAEGGAVVAIDVATGQVLVCASYPTYDLSHFFEDYNDLLEAEDNPLFNRALLGAYPPGSAYKMSTLIAAINSGRTYSGEEIQTLGKFDKYEGLYATCMIYSLTGRNHGTITAATALKVSCNYYFYELGDRLSLSAMDSTAKHLGLGEPTGIELPESTGYRANKETKAKLYSGYDTGWFIGDQILSAIGQSDNRFTPIQLCVYASTLANQGTRYKATFMNRVVSADYQTLLAENKPTVADKFDISADAVAAYSEGMQLVTGDPNGTAYREFRGFPIAVAGKTGTAEEHRGYSDNGAFICYAPADDPQIAIAVYIEKGGHGNTVASVARAILEVYFDVDEVGDVVTYENRLS